MQTAKVRTIHNVPRLLNAGLLRTKHTSVMAIFADADEMEMILDSVENSFVYLVNTVAGKQVMMSHDHFFSTRELYLMVQPMDRTVRHYPVTFFKVDLLKKHAGFLYRKFGLRRMTAVPHEVQPVRTGVAMARPMTTIWEGPIGTVPMGYALPDEGWMWKLRLALVALNTRQNENIDFRLDEIFVMLDGRDKPVRNWPNFFKVTDGGYGISNTFRPVPMQMVEATDVLTAYVPHKTFDGW